MPGLHKKIMYFKNRSCWQVKVKECGMVMSKQSPLQVPESSKLCLTIETKIMIPSDVILNVHRGNI